MGYCRSFLIFICVTSVVAKKHEDVVRDTQAALKKLPNPTWTAGVNDVFKGKDVRDIAKLNGYTGTSQGGASTSGSSSSSSSSVLTPVKPQIGRINPVGATVPDSFDWRNETAGLSVRQIRDQGQCGSCWAVSSSSVMADRYFLWKNVDVFMSSKQIMACLGKKICDGGYPSKAMNYATTYGVASGGDLAAGEPPGCIAYSTSWTGKLFCPSKCENGSLISDITTYYQTGQYYNISTASATNEQQIMQEVYNYGPVVVGFWVYQDFQSYKTGVYSYTYGPYQGKHAVRLIGWGVENGTKYWLLTNSWGANWGLNGTVKIKRGTNECGVEQDMTTVYPPEAYN